MKNNAEMYHCINTFLNTHILSWTLMFCHVWRPFCDECTSLPEGHHENQSFNITIIMLVNAKWCRSNNFLSLRPFERICKSDLKQYSIWQYIHIAINNLVIKWIHDDVIKWKHFPRYWPFVRGIHRSLVNSPHKGKWRGALMFSLIYARINGWVNNGEAGDLRRHRAHYDVTVMN